MGRGFGGRGGFGGLGDMGKLMKQAQKMQEDMLAEQERLKDERIESTAGGAVKAVVDGKGRLVSVEIQKEAVDPDDVEMLQDMLVLAIKEAQEIAEEQQEERMQKIAGGLGNLPPGLF